MENLDELLKSVKEKNDFLKNKDRLNKKHSIKGMLEQRISPWYKFLYQLGSGLGWFYRFILAPVLRFFRKIIVYIYLIYRNIWEKVVYVTDKDKETRFSVTKAGIFVTGTIASFFVWAVVLGLLFDAALYATTVRYDEHVYLTNQQEIIPGTNTHSVQGCHALPCTDQNSIYFRVHATLFNEIWSLLHHGEFFFADYVAAAVPIGVSHCVITSYGIRMKLFMRGLEIYPHLIKVSCEPVIVEQQK